MISLAAIPLIGAFGCGSGPTNVAVPTSQAALASAYHRVIDQDVDAILSEVKTFRECTDGPKQCSIAYYGALGPQADKTLKEITSLTVPQCLSSANSELVTAMNAFSQSSRAVLSDISDPAAEQADLSLYGSGIEHFNTARNLLAQASCSG